MKRGAWRGAALLWVLGMVLAVPAIADDSEVSRRTLKGLAGVRVVVEELQPNLTKYERYARQFDLSQEGLQRDIESALTAAGIPLLSGEAWQRAPGRPVLYVNVNTHESEKYWFSYDIKLELRQVAILEANPGLKTLAVTWSMNITGMTNIGNLRRIRQDLATLTGRFIQAFQEK